MNIIADEIPSTQLPYWSLHTAARPDRVLGLQNEASILTFKWLTGGGDQLNFQRGLILGKKPLVSSPRALV